MCAPYVRLTVISPDLHHKDMWPQQLWLVCYTLPASSSSNMEQTKERLTKLSYLSVSLNHVSKFTIQRYRRTSTQLQMSNQIKNLVHTHTWNNVSWRYTRGRKLLQIQASKVSSCQTWCMWALCHCQYSIKDFPNMTKYDCYVVPPLQDWRKIKWWSEEREDTVVFFEISLVHQIFSL